MYLTKKFNGFKNVFLKLVVGIVFLSLALALAPVSVNFTAAPTAKAETWWGVANQGGLNEVGKAYGTTDPSMPSNDIRIMVARLIRRVLELLGLLFLILIIVAGFRWMTAGGDEEKVTAAKKLLTNSVIGLIIILVSFAISTYILNQLIFTLTGVQPISWSF